jgi:hypothetical protein
MSPETTYIVIINDTYAYVYTCEYGEDVINKVIDLHKEKMKFEFESYEKEYEKEGIFLENIQEVNAVRVYQQCN